MLEILDNAQRVQVVIEVAAVRAHGGVESVLAGMPERRMADIVRQRQRLDQIVI